MSFRRSITLVACLSVSASLLLSSQNVLPSWAAQPCQSQRFAYTNALKREKDAQRNLDKEQRTLQSLQFRLQKDVEKKEVRNQRCQDRVAHLSDTFMLQLNRLEDQRRRYIAQIAELTVQRLECEAQLLTRFCDPNRFYIQIQRLARTITLAETRIASLRSSQSRRLQTEQQKCDREQAQLTTVISRSQARVDAEGPKIAAKQAALDTATATRVNAETLYTQCQNATPTPTPPH